MMTTPLEVPLILCAMLPPFSEGLPSETCPACGAAQVPPESDGGLPPPEMHQYQCGASYLRPEDQPGPWEPYHRCGSVPLIAVAAWIRDLCARVGAATAAPLADAVLVSPPYASTHTHVLEVLFGNIQAEQPPQTCPSCGASGTLTGAGFWTYACGATFMSTSARPGPSGYIPMSWVGMQACPAPLLRCLLELLRRKANEKGDHLITSAAEATTRLECLVHADGASK
jgi:hypothetical protein